MIFVTGDIHGAHGIHRLISSNFTEGVHLTKNDYLICTGDFGLIWDVNTSSKEEQYWINWLTKKPWTTLFVDGNHECIFSGSDILTEKGWMNIVKAYETPGIKIANFDSKTKKIYFDYPSDKTKIYKEKCVVFDGDNTKQIVSLNHDVIINNTKIKAKDLVDLSIAEGQFILKGENAIDSEVDIEDNVLKLLTWVIMDGTMVDHSKYMPNSQKKRIQFKLSRQDKIDNLTSLLQEMNIPYTIKPATLSKINVLQPFYIRIYADEAKFIWKELKGVKCIPFGWRNLSKRQTDLFIDTLIKTDGSLLNIENLAIIWRSTDKNNVDIIQELCIKNNYYFSFVKKENMSGFNKEKCKTQYICKIFKNKRLNKRITPYIKNHNDYMYCFTMPHGTLITRLEGKVAFTGNCFDRLNAFPRVPMFGGAVGVINDSIIHLRRGEIYTIEGSKFFTFGGAHSIDKLERRVNISWWEAELPSHSDIENAFTNLKKHNWEVDYVLTHTAPLSFIKQHFRDFRDKQYCPTAKFLDEIHYKINFKKWYFGHFHRNIQLDDKHICQYEAIERIL